MSDHPQNVHLARIIEGNEKIRKLNMEKQSLGERGTPSPAVAAVGMSGNSSSSGSGAAAGGGVVARVAVAGVKDLTHMEKVTTAWIDLQNAVNCYVDSDKDPNPLGSQGNRHMTTPFHPSLPLSPILSL